MKGDLITLKKSHGRFFNRLGSTQINREIHVMNVIFQIIEDKTVEGKDKLRIKIRFKD